MARFDGVPTSALAQLETTTTEVRRMVGEPLPSWVVLAAGAALLVVILAASLYVRSRTTA